MNTPVRWLTGCIETVYKVRKARISNLEELGRLQTLWSNLGGKKSQDLLNSKKFRVRDVLCILYTCDHPNCRRDLETIRYFMRNLDKIELKVTVVQEDGGEYTIHDGNKRAVAYYEASRQEGRNQVDLDIFVLQRKVAKNTPVWGRKVETGHQR